MLGEEAAFRGAHDLRVDLLVEEDNLELGLRGRRQPRLQPLRKRLRAGDVEEMWGRCGGDVGEMWGRYR